MTKTTALLIQQPQTITAHADALQLADDFLAEMKRRVESGELSEATRLTYARGLARFIDFAVSYRAADTNAVRAWLAALRSEKLRPASINTWLTGVRQFFAWSEGERRIPYNPSAGVHGAKRVGSKTHHDRDTLSDPEVLRILALPDDSDSGKRDRAYLTVKAYTGVRDIELHRADVADLRMHNKRLVLFVHGKGHASADEFVIITPIAEAALRDWLAVRGADPGALFISYSDRSRGDRLSLRAIRWMVKRYYQLAGITETNKTSHSLRHAAITNAIEHGASIPKAQSMARHENVTTTMIYFHEHDRVQNPAEDFVRYESKE